MNIYAHVLPVFRQEALNAIDELFGAEKVGLRSGSACLSAGQPVHQVVRE